jgi:hypothetical protein
MQNAVAQGYNPQQGLQEGAPEAGAYGAGVGAIAQGLMDVVLGRRGGKATTAPASVTPVPAGAAPEPISEPTLAAPEAVPENPAVAAMKQEYAQREDEIAQTKNPFKAKIQKKKTIKK